MLAYIVIFIIIGFVIGIASKKEEIAIIIILFISFIWFLIAGSWGFLTLIELSFGYFIATLFKKNNQEKSFLNDFFSTVSTTVENSTLKMEQIKEQEEKKLETLKRNREIQKLNPPKIRNNTIDTTKRSVKVFCPKCGAIMRIRRAKRGVYKGQDFYGCSTFPKCKGIINIEQKEDYKREKTINELFEEI